jgi:outer membrane protein TolC
MRSVLTLFVLSLFVGRAYAQPETETKAFSLQQAVSYALKNHLNMRVAEANIRDANWQVKEFTSIGLPQVNGGASYQYNIVIPKSVIPPFFPEQDFTQVQDVNGNLIPISYTRLDADGNPVFGGSQTLQFGLRQSLSGNINASILAFDGSYFVGLQAAKGLKEMTERQVGITEQEIKYNVSQAYLTAIMARQNKSIIEKNISNLERSLNELKAMNANGFIEQLDVDRLTLSLANLRTELQALTQQTELAETVLKFQMGFPLTDPIELTDDVELLLVAAKPVSADGEIDFSNRRELEIMDRNRGLNELNLKRLKAMYLPSVSVFAQAQVALNRNNLFTDDDIPWIPAVVAGVQVNVPIFDGFSKKASIERAKITLEKIEIQKDQFEQATTLQVINARKRYTIAMDRVESQKQNLALAEKIYNVTQVKYREGVGSSIEVSQAERELYQSQANYLNALYDLLQSQVDLSNALGTL